MPYRASADFISSLFGVNASASTSGDQSSNQAITNSQSMGLLEANVSSASIIADKKAKNSKNKITDTGDETSNISSDSSALVASTGPKGVSDGDDEDISPDQISIYVVRKKDSIAQIADMYDVTTNTILWANDLKKGDKLNEGDVLIIPPVSGVIHIVTKGQSLNDISKKYKVLAGDIAEFNGIAVGSKLAVGDQLIIPDGILADEGGSVPVKTVPLTPKYYDTHKLPAIVGYFMNPVPGARLTQALHLRYGVDLAISRGTPILASASGKVIFAKMGNNGGYGGLTIIDHPNGTETFYAHQSKIIVHAGDSVVQGQVIGYVGSTGRSTGPHVHFEIRGAQNPAAFLQVGSTLDANWK